MATKISNLKPLTGNKRSHALNATKTQQKRNKQTKIINGNKVIVTAKDLKTLNKKANVKNTKKNDKAAA